MNKLIVLFYCLMAVLAITCARPTSYFGVRPVFRNIAVYANPFVWLGKPTLPQRVPKNKSGKNKRRYRYKWFIEVDGKLIRSIPYFILFFKYRLHFLIKRNESLVGHCV